MPKQGITTHCILILIPAVMTGWSSHSYADAKTDGAKIVKGKIGIEIINKDKSTLARKRSRITTQDRLKVYTVTEFKSYTYVISSDKKTAALISTPAKSQVKAEEGLKKYSGPNNQFYQFDENSDEELITVICSPKELKEVQEMFSSKTVSHESWEAMEKELIKKSKALASIDVGKEAQIGGFIQMHGFGGVRSVDSFADKIPVRRGNYFLIKKYEFRVYNAKK